MLPTGWFSVRIMSQAQAEVMVAGKNCPKPVMELVFEKAQMFVMNVNKL